MSLFGAALAAPGSFRARQAAADRTPLQHFGKSVRGAPLSAAVKAGKLVFVSGTPGFDAAGKLAVGDFAAQMALPQPDFLLEIECEAGICRAVPSVSQVQLPFNWDDILLE